MIMNDGSMYRVVTDPAAQLRERTVYMFRAASARNGVPYVDTAFARHRDSLAAMPALCMYQFPWQNAGTPEQQAQFLIDTLGGGLRWNEMVMLDPEATSALTDPRGFVQRWLAHIEPRLACRAWVYVPSSLAAALPRTVTGDRIVMAPRYSGTPNRGAPPTWPWDVHQYTDQGPFPGCTQSGDTSFTDLTAQQMLERCNPGAETAASPCGGGTA
jgi:GH25 family lysozyme M1 (1,4-beta-N-acetylmuramidase)